MAKGLGQGILLIYRIDSGILPRYISGHCLHLFSLPGADKPPREVFLLEDCLNYPAGVIIKTSSKIFVSQDICE